MALRLRRGMTRVGSYLFVLRDREVPLLHAGLRQVHVDDDLIGDVRAGGLRLEIVDVFAVGVHGDAARGSSSNT